MTPDTLFDLSGKTALVTGGATGIGKMASHGLMAAGADVLIASRRGETCAAAAAELNDLGLRGRATGFAGDVGSEEGIEALAEAMPDELHILMNNAGVTWGSPLGQFPYHAWHKVMNVNVAGMFHLTQRLLAKLRAAGSAEDPARVVNVGSIMGDHPHGEGAYSYAMSKAAVHHMTTILAQELAGDHITVNALAPGPFPSDMTAFVTAQEASAAVVAKGVPRGRLGQASDVAGAMQYLCGLGGSYITGAILPLSGGMNAQTGPALFDEAIEALKP